jgi:Uma2 family endonuclease
MVQFKPVKPVLPKALSFEGSLENLPTEHDLPETDNRPVDNELQLLLPTLLRSILLLAWADRSDWFVGVNLGLYYDPARPAVGPDAFLSLGVPLYRPGQDLRLSYLIWQEGVVPQWVLEIVSKTPGGEYDRKMELYAQLGVSYYAIYNPKYYKRDRHSPFEVYQLVDDEYVLCSGNPVWMPEIGLGIGLDKGVHSGLPERDWLYWYDAQGNQYPSPSNVIDLARQQAEEARQQAEEARQQAEEARRREIMKNQEMEALLQKLRDRGIDPDLL